ncbi:MAG: hypothetical protein D6722_28525 [Bacteroidetes bacterium]|nr:MAG: hypothetical protein D6722_28525 [Bacteroidota bacterium]
MSVRLLVMVLSLLIGRPLWGQSCACTAPENAVAALEQADLAFVGRCTFAESNWISGGMKYSFQVEQSWKKTTSTLYILSTPWEQDCGYTFEPGQSYLVFVRRKFTPKTFQCMGNRPLAEAGLELEALGPGLVPEPSALLMPLYWTLGALGVAILIFMVLVVLRQRRRRAGV